MLACWFNAADPSNAEMTEIKRGSFWRAVAAEFVGMLLFIFIGLSAVVGKDKQGVPGEHIAQEVKVSLAFALAIATLAQSLGHISGAHLNPAVTLGLLVSCQISLLRCICYILAQMLGAVTASWIVNGYRSGNSLGVNKVRGQSCPLLDFCIFSNLKKNKHLTLCIHILNCSSFSFAAEQCGCWTRLCHRVPCHPSAGSVCVSSDW